MQKGIILILLSITFSSTFFLFVTAQTSNSNQFIVNKGSDFETVCERGSCTTSIYPTDKYFYKNGQWEEIDEGWFACGNNFCTRNYYFNATAEPNGLVKIGSKDRQLGQEISSFNNNPRNQSVSHIISGSIITYSNIFPNIDLRYQYLPHKLKEEFIVKEPIQGLLNNQLELLFNLSGNSFDIERPFICDSNRACKVLNYSLENNQISLRIPTSFLNNPRIVYPLIIDPSFTLANSSIISNGYVSEYYDPDTGFNTYSKIENPSSLLLGINYLGNSKGYLDWNLNSINQSEVGTITNITLGLFVESLSATNLLNINHMEQSGMDYSDEENYQLYSDIGDGILYASNSTLITNNTFVNLELSSYAIDDFSTSLGDTQIFSFGLDSYPSNYLVISARDNANASRRPILTITYDIPSSSANNAIQIGINNSLPNNPISTNQQVYVVGLDGQHYLGRFDKTTTRNNQTWAFNYGQPFANTPSLFNILNIWQNQSINYTEIVNQVQNFINNTIVL